MAALIETTRIVYNALSISLVITRAFFHTVLFAEQLAHNILIRGKKISAAVLIRHSLAFKIVCVFHVQHKKLTDLFFGKTLLKIKIMEGLVGFL